MDNLEMQASEEELIKWAAETMGGEVVRTEHLAGGNRRGACALDVLTPDGTLYELFLRYQSRQQVPSADPYTLVREAGVYRALARSDLPIPRLRATHPKRHALLVDRMSGSADYRMITSRESKEAIADDLMRALARLHAIDATELRAPELGSPGNIQSGVQEELRVWSTMYDETARLEPLIETALTWLRANVPADPTPASLVHGDAGPGNFLFQGDRVTALIDWELAHYGDPVEDLAWLSMRTVLEPFPDFSARIRTYERTSGRRIDRARLLYHRIFVALRVVIIRHRSQYETDESDAGNSLISRTVNRRLLVEALHEALGRHLNREEVVETAATELSSYFDYVLNQLRNVVLPRSTDPLVKTRIKGIARVVKFLKAYDSLRAVQERAERAELAELLGHGLESVVVGRRELAAAIREGRIGAAVALPYLSGQVTREHQLTADALGALATRSFPAM
jgi:aminoglycoside phosphotransferase (APT) family kinase protein